jgi:glycosyltransferase involved in cell wall biosynthesis
MRYCSRAAAAVGPSLVPSASARTATVNAWSICPTHDPSQGGLYRAINDIARGLGGPVLSFDDGRADRAALADGVHRVPCGPGLLARDGHVISPAAGREAERLLAAADLLVVHSLYRGHAPWAADLAARTGRPYWVVPHGCLDPWTVSRRAAAKRAWLTLVGRRYLAEAERIVFSTRRSLEKARPWVRGGRSVVIPWPVPLPSLADRDVARAAFRAARGIPADAPLLLFVGRLHPVKRPRETIAAFCRAAPPRCRLVLAGGDDGLTRDAVASGIPAGHADRVHCVGPLDAAELRQAYLAADGFISLSWQENFGYAAAEAAAYGLPLILAPGIDLAHEFPAAAPGGITCGWLLPDDAAASAEEAVAAWGRLAENAAGSAAGGPGGLTALGAQGRAWVGDTLDCERFRERLSALGG